MSKYDFSRRIKRMVHEECEIVKAEAKIAHKSTIFHAQIVSLKTMLARQEKALQNYRRLVEKLKRENEKLNNYKEKEEERICTIIKNVEKMQTEYRQTLQHQIEQRRVALTQMDCIRSIKKATQTYINLDALPQLIQGVTISEKEVSSEWKPFCIDPTKHTQKEVQDAIWNDSLVDSSHRETWEKLILGDLLNDESQSVNMDVQIADEIKVLSIEK